MAIVLHHSFHKILSSITGNNKKFFLITKSIYVISEESREEIKTLNGMSYIYVRTNNFFYMMVYKD